MARRRRKQNPPEGVDSVLTFGGIGGVLSAALGAPQLGGVLLLGSGTYAIAKGKPLTKAVGAIYDLFGLGMVIVRR